MHLFTLSILCFLVVLGFKELLEAPPNVRRSGKKQNKHLSSSSSIGSRSIQAGTQFAVPVIAPGAAGRTMNHRDDTASGLSGGQKATKFHRVLAKFNILPFNANRCRVVFMC